MKKIFSFILITMLFSCSEDFPDRQPEDTLSTDAFYNNPAEIKAGLVACYAPLQAIYAHNQLPQYLEIASDDAKDVLWQSVDYLFKKTSSNSRPAFWQWQGGPWRCRADMHAHRPLRP